MAQLPIVALDIGATKVASAVGVPKELDAGIDLIGSSMIMHSALADGGSLDPVILADAIDQAIAATGARGPFGEVGVVCMHPSFEGVTLKTSVPLADEPVVIKGRDLDRLRTSVLNIALGVDRDALYVERLSCSGNGFKNHRDPRGLSATRLTGEFNIVTMPMAVRRSIVQAVDFAGLDMVYMSATPPALLAGMSDQIKYGSSVLLIEVGGSATSISSFSEGVCKAIKIFPWGGLTIAEAIAKEERLTMQQAVTLSLEGTSSQRSSVRNIIKHNWEMLRKPINDLRKHEPKSDMLLLGGRGSLIDGFSEWIETATQIRPEFCRSVRTQTHHDLSKQLGISAAVGLLEGMQPKAVHRGFKSGRLLDRVIHRTKSILTDYF